MLEHVFTHTSWAPDRASSYERLEFLGDSVLELAVARALYEHYPDFTEGQLAKIRSHVVSRASCAVVAARARTRRAAGGVGPGRRPQDELERLSRNRNVLAALLEAALGGALPGVRLRADRGRRRRRLRGPHRVRAHDPRRPQDGAPGGAGPARPLGDLLRARRRRPAARPHVHVRGGDRRRGGRRRQGAVEEGRGAGSRPRGAREHRGPS